MKLLKQLLRDRKGISMTEVIVAMATVVIVTGAAISVVVASVKSDLKYKEKTAVLGYCQSAVECVRFADSEEMLSKTLDLLKAGFGTATTVGDNKVFSLKEGDSTLEVVVTSVSGTDNYVVKLNDEVIYETSK